MRRAGGIGRRRESVLPWPHHGAPQGTTGAEAVSIPISRSWKKRRAVDRHSNGAPGNEQRPRPASGRRARVTARSYTAGGWRGQVQTRQRPLVTSFTRSGVRSSHVRGHAVKDAPGGVHQTEAWVGAARVGAVSDASLILPRGPASRFTRGPAHWIRFRVVTGPWLSSHTEKKYLSGGPSAWQGRQRAQRRVLRVGLPSLAQALRFGKHGVPTPRPSET